MTRLDEAIAVMAAAWRADRRVEAIRAWHERTRDAPRRVYLSALLPLGEWLGAHPEIVDELTLVQHLQRSPPEPQLVWYLSALLRPELRHLPEGTDMCTSLLHAAGPGGFLLMGNRDELHTRARAILPSVHELRRTRAIYPIDATAGGTWIGVNAHGLAVSLLNFYDAAPQTPAIEPYHSRGHVPTALLDARSLDEALEVLRDEVYPNLKHMQPFVALVAHAATDGPARAVRVVWSGDTITQAPLTLPHIEVSSGFLVAEVRPARVATVRAGIAGLDPVHDPVACWMAPFAQHDPARGRHSVCMRDDFSRTMSHTAVEVRPGHVRMTYLDGPPCDAPTPHVVELARTHDDAG